MRRRITIFILGLMTVLALVACGGSTADNGASEPSGSSSQSGEAAAEADAAEKVEVTMIVAQISDDFAGALSPMGQLALGTLRLEDGPLAVGEEQAAQLLPLWQALQSLSNSETTAQVELDAVVKQIQGLMSAEQVAAIAEMQLTEDSLTEMMESGELGFRGFGGRNSQSNAESEGGFPLPPGGFGGGPGGGFGPPGGGPGGGFGGNLSEDDIATRRAEFAESGLGDSGERFLTGAVVRLMQTKTGEAPAGGSAGGGALFETVFTVVEEETGMTLDAIQSAMAEGQTLAQIIESNGGDVEAVRQAMIEAFEALPDAGEIDVEERADQWLNQEPGQ